jgi:hypothetical protein
MPTAKKRAREIAARDLETYRSEFGHAEPDEPWFTTAFEYEREPGCSWSTYWAAVKKLYRDPDLIEPVTTSGWYKTVDGRWRHAQWNNGRFRLGSPREKPPTQENQDAELEAEYEAQREADNGSRPADAFPSIVPPSRQ